MAWKARLPKIHSFIQKVFLEHLSHARHYAWHCGYIFFFFYILSINRILNLNNIESEHFFTNCIKHLKQNLGMLNINCQFETMAFTAHILLLANMKFAQM